MRFIDPIVNFFSGTPVYALRYIFRFILRIFMSEKKYEWSDVMDRIEARNKGEEEFLQAVREVG